MQYKKVNKNKVLFNILTRTSNRPIGFKKCFASVFNQTYKNVKHIVSFDDLASKEYLLKYPTIKTISVLKKENPNSKVNNDLVFAPYNLYCNALLDEVKDGWIIFLDDDVNLLHNKVLEELSNEILKADEDTMFVFQLRYPNGKLLPSNKVIKEKQVKIQNIDTACYLFHSKYKNTARWDEWKASDYRFIKQLETIVPKIKWLEKVYIQNNNFEDLGNRNDLNNSVLPDYSYNKNWLWHFLPKYHYQLNGIYIFQSKTYINFTKKQFRKVKLKMNKLFNHF